MYNLIHHLKSLFPQGLPMVFLLSPRSRAVGAASQDVCSVHLHAGLDGRLVGEGSVV